MSKRPKKITIINPSDDEALTERFQHTLRPFEFNDSFELNYVTLTGGPAHMVTQENIDSVALPMAEIIKADDTSDAFIIGCYADPGLWVCREAAGKRPVFGINESAVLTALSRGEKFGIIAIQPHAIRRHVRHMRQLGLLDRFAGERWIGLTAEDADDETKVAAAALKVGAELRDLDGAEVVIIGVGAAGAFRAPLEEMLGVPVIDPVQAAVAMAMGQVTYSDPAGS
ncbi:aspartate/glutamate racemase family protein [Microbacterium sp.]|uniref:aspartate/glutamate racemase family protein n=1 Tax=Microbacterium sp. TaxID=51671 RepID=UPI0039E5D6DE